VRRILSLLCDRRKRISHLLIYIWSSRKHFVVHVDEKLTAVAEVE